MQRVSQSYKADAQDAQPLVAERQPGLWDSMSTMLADHIHHVDERRIWNAAFPVPCPLSSWKATAHPSLTLARWPQKRTKDSIGVTVTRNSERKTARDHRDPCVVLLANSLNPVETFPWFVYMGCFMMFQTGRSVSLVIWAFEGLELPATAPLALPSSTASEFGKFIWQQASRRKLIASTKQDDLSLMIHDISFFWDILNIDFL